MNTTLPARLSSTELMPPESHLRPGFAWRFWIHYFTAFGLTLLTFFSFALGFGLPAVVFGVFTVVQAGLMRRQSTRANAANQRGVNLLNAGEFHSATAIFEKLAHERSGTLLHVVFTYNVAVAVMLEGRHQRALSIFNAVESSKQFRRPHFRQLLPTLYTEMGCCLALTGDLQQARQRLRLASELLQPPEDGALLFLEAVIALRSGDPEGAVRRIEQQWRRAEGALRAPTVRTLRMVYAFALAQLGRANSELFRNLVAGAMPSVQHDFHWATVSWPEFDEFVRSNVPA